VPGKKGFTLVEISIVLVVIGLLIGGILVAQSLLSSTKVHKFTQQLSQYDVAVRNFRTKFAQWPGDANVFSHSIGNNNGIISGTEGSNFWVDLSVGVNIKNARGENYQAFIPGMGPGGFGPIDETTCPTFKIEQETAEWPCLTVGYFNNAYVYTNTKPENVGPDYYPLHNPLKPKDAAGIDAKMDDGKPSEGRTRGTQLTTSNMYSCFYSDALTGDSYAVASDEFTCTLVVDLDMNN
jgi:prepilin-type N-terminal cleavage/methylation domain-containing protein